MNASPAPIHTDIVLVGGGHSHVAVLKSFGMRPVPGVRITLIARDVLTPYSGMLPGLMAGHYTHAEAHVDLQRLCRFAGARLYHAPAEAIDFEAMRVRCHGRPAVGFDWLSLDMGSVPDTSGLQLHGASAVSIKPVDEFLAAWPAIEARCLAAEGTFDIVTIGAGAGGVELTLSLHHRLARKWQHTDRALPRFHVVSATENILPTHNAGVQRCLRRAMHDAKISLHAPAQAAAVEAHAVVLRSGERLPADAVILTTSARPAPWLAETGLALDGEGFVRVDETLRSTSHERVFAVGDIASFSARPLPKSGVYAVRQGPVLAENLRRAVAGKTLRRYRAQARTLALISTGAPNAVASYGPLAVEGKWVWQAKDWIDRRWMAKYQDLPEMDDHRPPPVPATVDEDLSGFAMRCGGCGSKVASPVLRRVLNEIETPTHPDVLVGLAQSDDAAVMAIPPEHLLVQSIDHFRTFIDDPYAFARVTANHCLSDLFAMGAKPHTVQAMVSLPFASESKVESDLLALLTGVSEALAEAGAALVGGHTAEGPELTLGLSVNGLVRRDAVLTKGGVRAGDRLVLTKPIGTGVIFAADMRAKASAATVDGALTQMLLSNQRAAEILLANGAHACTDVTGFGLAGHLIEMLRASAIDAALDLSEVPLLVGADALFRAGIRSSLHAGNSAFLERLQANGADDDQLAALVDPQTAGGLLAALPADRADACVDALRAIGYETTAVIGQARAVGPSDLREAGRIWLS